MVFIFRSVLVGFGFEDFCSGCFCLCTSYRASLLRYFSRVYVLGFAITRSCFHSPRYPPRREALGFYLSGYLSRRPFTLLAVPTRPGCPVGVFPTHKDYTPPEVSHQQKPRFKIKDINCPCCNLCFVSPGDYSNFTPTTKISPRSSHNPLSLKI